MKISIYEFNNYKKFLMSRVRERPSLGRGELSKIAQKLGTSSVAISQVVRGDRNFTHEQALEVAEYLELGELETEYFLLLVLLERAGTFKLKRKLNDQLEAVRKRAQTLKSRVPHHQEMDSNARSEFYSHWYYSGIRLLSSIGDYQSIETIAKRMSLSENRVREVVEFLLRYGLCVEKDGQIQMGPRMTHLEASSPLVTRHHSNWRLKGIENMDGLEPEELFYTGPMTISLASMKIIRKELLTTIENIAREVSSSPSEQLACLNIDWFLVQK